MATHAGSEGIVRIGENQVGEIIRENENLKGEIELLECKYSK